MSHAWMLLAAATTIVAGPPGMDEGQVTYLKDAKWVAASTPGIPAGVWLSPVAGDAKTGPSVAYAKFAAGFVFPAHWHSHAESIVFLSGKGHMVIDGKDHDLIPGTYLVVPAKATHQLSCGSEGECVILSRRAGPTDYHFVK
jgi:quercetin dioxygenase-like cupin family protein